MSKDKDLKTLPVFTSDDEAEAFVDEADLSEYDLSGFKSAQFEFQKKDARLEVRLSQDQMLALKAAAKREGIPHTRLVRQFIDRGIASLL